MSSEYTHFQILPGYKFQNERDKFIKFNENIYIASLFESQSKEIYLSCNPKFQEKRLKIHSFAELVSENEKFLFVKDSNKSRRNPPAKYSFFFKKNDENMILDKYLNLTQNKNEDLNMTFDKVTKFKFSLFQSNFGGNEKILYGDIVWISQIERDCYLQFLRKNSENNQFVIVFEHISENEFKNSIGMWKIEPFLQNESAQNKGGVVKWGDKVRFRNLR